MNLRRLYSLVSVTEFVMIIIMKGLQRLSRLMNSDNYYNRLSKLVDRYDAVGYRLIETKDSSLLMSYTDVQTGKEIKLYIRPYSSDTNVFTQVIEKREYLPLITMINSIAPAQEIEVIIDAGANIGLTSLFLKAQFPSGRFFCIEADLQNYLQLQKNISVNSYEKDVCVLHRALWTIDSIQLQIKNDFRDGSDWAKRVAEEELADNHESKVTSITLRNLVQEKDIKSIDVLKIDIEGAEIHLFKDNDFIEILTSMVKFLAVELHPDLGGVAEIENCLHSNNFVLYERSETYFYYNKTLLS